MDPKLIEEIKSNVRTIQRLESTWVKKPNANLKDIARGLQVSKIATAHPNEVPMTPILHNMLVAFGDIDDDGRLLTGSPITKAEKWIYDSCSSLLLQQSKKKSDHYDSSLPLRSIQHYYTDCWLNLKENWRDIVPGQVEEIDEMIRTYMRPTVSVGIDKKLNDPVFAKAVELVIDELPSVSATHEIVRINLPFMTKHTNVGYPFFSNDRSIDHGSNKTYAQVTMDIATKLKDVPEAMSKWNYTTEFARYQRGKGRLIQAISRVPNLIMNQLEAVEIANYKARSSLFAGYNDDKVLQGVLTEMLSRCEANGDVLYNLDYHRYDSHVNREFIELLGAISAYKCTDSRSKEIALYRAALMTKTWLVAGTLDNVVEVYGRIFSGFIDTNRGGGLINAINMTHLLMMQDPHYVRDIYSPNRYKMLVMGDDVLAEMKRDTSISKITEQAKLNGFEIDDPTKNAFGPKFLQYRVYESLAGQLVMAYPWDRVYRSMLYKEQPSGLGECGWELTMYQQLGKLVQDTDQLAIVVNLIAPFDRNHLMLDRSVSDIIAGAKEEDIEGMKKRNSRYMTTAERLNDGDPSKQRQFNGDTLNPNYFDVVQNVIKSVYDPNFLQNHGIAVPKLRT